MSTLATPPLLPGELVDSTGYALITHVPGRRSMARRYTNIVINLTLLGLVVFSFVTGWIASLLGLTEFGLHKYSSVALLLVASGHVVLHWRSLKTQLRNLGTSHYDRRYPVQQDRRNAAQPDRRARER